MSVSDDILSANSALLNEMLAHPFVRDIENDRLPREVFHRYLAFEGAFVKTALSIFAYATARAPDIAAQRWLIDVLDTLANEQVVYFEEVFERRAISPPDEMPPEVTAFDRGMLGLAENRSFIDIVTAMFAAEWMYWTWCARAAVREITDLDLKKWVDLHAEPAFERQALWLKSAIDRTATPEDLDRLAQIFAQVTQLEIDFHTAAYLPGAP